MKNFLYGGIVGGTIVFLCGIPPFSDIVRHFFDGWHPIARQLKVARTISEWGTLPNIVASIDLGLFDLLKEEGPLSTEVIALKLGVPKRGIEALVDTLCASDYLYSMGDGTYDNSPTSLHHLTSGLDYRFDMKPVVQLMGNGFMQQLATSTTEAVRNGGSVSSAHAESFDHPFWSHFSKVTGNMALMNAGTLTRDLDYAIGANVLDVASGSGEYGFAALARNTTQSVTFQDYPNVLEQVKMNAKYKKLDMAKAKYLPGSFFDIPGMMMEGSDDLKLTFDTVIAANIIHHFSPATTLQFLRLAHAALEKDGYIVIAEICPPSEPYRLWEGMSMARAFSMTMLTWSKEGKAYKVAELHDLLDQSDFYNIHTISSFPFTTFVVAQRK